MKMLIVFYKLESIYDSGSNIKKGDISILLCTSRLCSNQLNYVPKSNFGCASKT